VSERFRPVAEQAEWLLVSEKTVRRHAAAMGGVKAAGRLLFPESKTLAYLETQSLGPRKGVRSIPKLRRAQ
jgi:hypothetical protein